MQADTHQKAIIVGAGIGGLTSALALQRAGYRPLVFERWDELSKIQIGGGLTLWNNATRALRQLDIDERLQSSGTTIQRVEFRTWSGGLLGAWDMTKVDRKLGTPTIGLSRADLHPILAESLAEGTLQLNEWCIGYDQDATGVTVHFASGREERGDLLIGADGINSIVRSQQLGVVKPRYAGYTIWQGLANLKPGIFPSGVVRILFGRGMRFTGHHVGGDKLFWMCVANAPEGEKDPVELRKQMLLDRFGHWMKPIGEIIESTDMTTTQRFDVQDRPAIKSWGDRRVTMLGDAAHPMTPNMSQGACQAIEDAVVLGRCLREIDNVPAALRTYETQRMARTEHIATIAWRLGKGASLENPLVVGVRTLVMRAIFNRVLLNAHQRDMAYEF